MPHCRSSIVRLCVRRAELVAVNAAALMHEHGVSEESLADPEQRVPWPFFSSLLARLEAALGGPLALEQFGAEVAAAHPLFRILHSLHFGLAELQQIAAERLIPHLFDGLVQSPVAVRADGAVRITLSLARESQPSYPFWTFLLGIWRPMPRLLGLGDCYVEVEMADRFAEFLVILPTDAPSEQDAGQEIRRRVRESLLKDLVRYEELQELPKPDTKSSILERRIFAAAAPDDKYALGLRELEDDIRQKLMVQQLQLFEMSRTGLRRIGSNQRHIEGPRIRRVFWLSGAPIGAIEIERSGEAGHAREASLLDEHIESFTYRFADVQNRLPFASGSVAFTPADPELGDPGSGEPPPSSRGRVARAAREGRLRELTEEWQLSERQRSVLALLVDGLGNREIAVRLGCSIGTIENHVTKLLKRATVDNRAALTATFWRTQRR